MSPPVLARVRYRVGRIPSEPGLTDTSRYYFVPVKDYQGRQIARYFSSNLLFSAGFNHFPSIYQYFDFRNVILVAMAMLLRTRNPIVTFRTLSH